MSLYDSLLAKIYLMEKHIKESEQKPETVPWYLSADRWSETAKHLKLGFYKALLALARIGLILRGKPASSFTVFTRAGKEGLYICNYSYCYYKDFHHKTRNKTIATIIAATVILSIIVSLIFPGQPRARAAVYSWTQTNWSGGGSALTASHTLNQTGWTNYSTGASSSILGSASNIKLNLTNTTTPWNQTNWSGGADTVSTAAEPTNRTNWTKFYSKDANIDNSTVGQVKESLLAGASQNWVQTSDTDFNAGAKSANISVIGTGVAANLILCDVNHGGLDWTPANGSSIDGIHCNIGTFTITAGYTVYVTAYNGTTYGRLQVYANAANIAGTLSATGAGYAAGSGPGAGGGGAAGGGGGGGYGGPGGNGNGSNAGGVSNGSITAPNDLGSGGGNGSVAGSLGGGSINLNISGTLTNNGIITANGYDGGQAGGSAGGAGAGGTVYISAGTLAGNGTITANGGIGSINGGNGGGGGGRIALYYTTKTYTGTSTATGGTGAYVGGAGTIYQKAASQTYGDLTVDNNSVSGTATPLDVSRTFDNLTIQNQASFTVPSGLSATANNSGAWTISGTLTNNGTFTANSITSLTTSGNFTNNNIFNATSLTSLTIGVSTTFTVNTFSSTTTNLPALTTLAINGTLTHLANTTTKTNYINWSLANLTINSGGAINVSGKGYAAGSGPGAGGGGAAGGGGGGGYGGPGGNGNGSNAGGVSNGSITAPNDLGSGGGNGSVAGSLGGGSINLNISGTLTNNGIITANGYDGGQAGGSAGGAGAGGTVYISAGTLAGNGTITANGGIGSINGGNGGGGGGRIALYYTTKTYTGTSTATGGTGAYVGGAGTINDGGAGSRPGPLGYAPSQSQISNLKSQISLLRQDFGGQANLPEGQAYGAGKSQNLPDNNFNIPISQYPNIQNSNLISTIKSYLSKALDGVKGVFNLAFGIPTAYASTGDFTSQVFDTTAANVTYQTISWTATVPTGTTLKFQVASNNDNATWNFVGSDGTAGTYYTTSGSAIWSGASGAKRYIKFKAFFDNALTEMVIVLSDVTLAYALSGYPASQTLVSSKYQADLGMNDNRLKALTWNETKPLNTNIKFQVRTASSAVGLDTAPWCGPDDGIAGSCTTTTYFTTNTGQTIDDVNSNGTNNQWIQYKVFLGTTDGVYTATLSGVSLGYANNLTGNFTSSAYNTEKTYNVPSQLIWNEDATLPANTTLKFQIATSPDNSAWTSFVGPGDSVSTYYDSANSAGALCSSANCCSKASQTVTCNIPQISVSDGYADQWIKYKAYYDASANLATSPTLSSTSFKYDQNTTPTVSVTSASEGSDGTISVGYNLSDDEQTSVTVSLLADVGVTLNQVLSNDTTGGTINVSGDISSFPSSGTIQVENEQITYTGKGAGTLTGAVRAANSTKYAGHASGTTVWIKGTAVGGNVGALTGITSTPAAKTATWTITSDLPGVFRDAVASPAKIRVSANDLQIGNPVGTGDSSNMTIDTKVPAGAVPVKIDSTVSSPTANLTISVTDNSALYMRFANAANINGSTCSTDLYGKTTAQVAYVSYAASYALYPLAPDTNGVSTVCYQFKDAYNNILQGYASTPQIPINTQINDVSVPPATPPQYKLLVYWNTIPDPATGNAANTFTTYHIWRATSASGPWDNTTEITNSLISRGDALGTRAHNYFIDDNGGSYLNNTTTYYYKVAAESVQGKSNYSIPKGGTASYPIVSGTANGSGSGTADTSAPTISNISSGSVTTSSAAITWTTSDIDGQGAYSLVRYGKTTALGSIASGDSFPSSSATAHTVNLSGLDAGATYYYQVLSADPVGNLMKDPNVADGSLTTSNLHSFTVSAPSVVDANPSYVASINSAAIYWTTTGTAGSQIRYIASPGNPSTGTSTTLNTEKSIAHYAVIPSGLVANTTYNYQIVLQDGNGNSVVYPTTPGTYYTFTTQAIDAGATTPIITDTTSATQAATSANITWTTDQSAYSIVEYGPTTSLGFVAGDVSTYITTHSVSISNLTPGATYYYKIRSANSYGKLATSPGSGTSTFSTASLTISGSPSVTPSRSGAVITWTTNGIANSQVKYGISSTLTGASLSALQSAQIVNHIVSISLNPDTTYYYQAISNDGSNNPVTSSISSFNTTSGTKPAITAGSATPADNSATVTFSSTSNNSTPLFLSVEYQVSNTTPSSYTNESANPSAISSGVSGTVTLAGLTPNTKHYYRLKARDAFGNTKIDDNSGAGYSFTTTIDSTPPAAITNLSAAAASSSSATLTWTAPGNDGLIGTATSYDIRYSTSTITDANWASATPVTSAPKPAVSGTVQQMTVTGLNPTGAGATYYFAIKTSDAIPNTSSLSNVVSADIPAQLDTTPPAITAVSASSITAAGATIGWTTDKNSSSLVDFGPTTSYGTTQGNSADSTKSHFVNLVGLAPATTYNYQVKSTDSSGNIGYSAKDSSGLNYSFTTLAASSGGTLPIISSVQAAQITASSAVITWTTSVNSDSTVGYSLDKSYALETGNTSSLTNHSVTLINLASSSPYYYQVKSRNGNQLAVNNNNTAGFTFTTLAGADTTPPSISGVQVSRITSNSATIIWTTANKNSNSYVEFGTALNAYSSVQGNPNDSTTAHTVQLTSLTPEKKYYFQVRSTDAAGNKAVDNNAGAGYTFTTTTGAAVDCPPVGRTVICPTCDTCPAVDTAAPKITNVKVADITFNSATIVWSTDKSSNSMALYDTVSYGVKQSYTYSSGQMKDSQTSHKVTLNNLDSDTTYYFRVSSADSRGNTAESDDQSFKTIAITQAKDKGEAAAVSLKKQFEDIAQTLVKQDLATEENIKDIVSRIANPPIIGQEGPIVKNVKSYGATIVWQTDRKANSVVKFKPASSPSQTLGAGNNWKEIGKMDSYDVKHEVELLGLAPSTTYAFQVKSQDVLGNATSSEPQTFTTSSNSSIFNVGITDITLNSAKINWETANLSTSLVEYGLTSAYGNQANKGEEKVKQHSVDLTNLSSGTTYHFRIRSVEESSNILSTEDYTFATYQLPQITKYDLGEIKDNSIELKWASNIPIDANVRYTDKDTNETKIAGAPEKSLDHKIVLGDLSAGKSYSIQIQGRDENNNLAELPAFEVQTGIDTVPPDITQVRSQAAILGGAEDKVQAIISWKTNELSTSQMLWDLGTTKGDTFANQSKVDANLTTNHISVITSFKPGTVYRFRVVSADKFGNTSTSPDYSILTPIRRQSVVQMIMSNFEKIFGWTRNLGR